MFRHRLKKLLWPKLAQLSYRIALWAERWAEESIGPETVDTKLDKQRQSQNSTTDWQDESHSSTLTNALPPLTTVGPPAHWVALVRQHAPELLSGQPMFQTRLKSRSAFEPGGMRSAKSLAGSSSKSKGVLATENTVSSEPIKSGSVFVTKQGVIGVTPTPTQHAARETIYEATVQDRANQSKLMPEDRDCSQERAPCQPESFVGNPAERVWQSSSNTADETAVFKANDICSSRYQETRTDDRFPPPSSGLVINEARQTVTQSSRIQIRKSIHKVNHQSVAHAPPAGPEKEPTWPSAMADSSRLTKPRAILNTQEQQPRIPWHTQEEAPVREHFSDSGLEALADPIKSHLADHSQSEVKPIQTNEISEERIPWMAETEQTPTQRLTVQRESPQTETQSHDMHTTYWPSMPDATGQSSHDADIRRWPKLPNTENSTAQWDRFQLKAHLTESARQHHIELEQRGMLWNG